MKPKIIPVVEEKVEIGARRVETGRVRVRKHVEEHTEQVDVPVSREIVDIRRVAVDRPIDAVPSVRRTENEIIVPVVEEQVVVTKRLVLKEEIHLITRRETERSRQAVKLRRERAEIERG
jgi:uncharacterized protein (TIGR02271 family)